MPYKVGDIVVANELSNSHYSQTTERRGWRGRVVSVGIVDENTIRVSGIDEFLGEGPHTVNARCFDLDPSSESWPAVEAPDGDLFAALYT